MSYVDFSVSSWKLSSKGSNFRIEWADPVFEGRISGNSGNILDNARWFHSV